MLLVLQELERAVAERRDEVDDQLGQVALEVAVAPAGERSGPQAGESRVVDISDSFERVERLGTRLVSDTRLCEAVVELAA